MRTKEAILKEMSVNPNFQKFGAWILAVKNGKSDEALLGEFASCANGCFRIDGFDLEFQRQFKYAMEKGWLIECPARKGWFTIKDEEEQQ